MWLQIKERREELDERYSECLSKIRKRMKSMKSGLGEGLGQERASRLYVSVHSHVRERRGAFLAGCGMFSVQLKITSPFDHPTQMFTAHISRYIKLVVFVQYLCFLSLFTLNSLTSLPQDIV